MKKQTITINDNQLKTLIKKILNETMQDQVPGMPRFHSREEYNQWLRQQKALTKGMDDDEYDKTTYGQFEKAKTDRYWNQIANLDGKKVYQPVGGAGLSFNDFKDKQQKGKTNDGVYRNFVQKRTQTMPNGGKKWIQNVSESQLNQIIKESIKKVLNERKPTDRQVGPHLFKGVKYDTNGNPNYTCDTVPDEWKKTMRWKMSQKHGLHGQLGDPSKVPGVISEEYNSDSFSLAEKKPVFTVDAFNVSQEEGFDDMQITAQIYYSEEEAIEAARQGAKKYSNWDNQVILFTVYAGEYELQSGDIYGEPYDIYCVSNSNRQTTMMARKQSGFASLEVDEYLG